MKGLRFLSFGLLLIAVGCSPAESPQSDSSESDDSARAVDARARMEATPGGQLVLRAIDAHGGLEAWFAAPTSSYAWEYANVGSDLRFKSFMVVDNASRFAYHDLQTLGSYAEARPIEGQFAWDGVTAWIHPDTLSQPNPMFWATTGYYFESIPFILSDPGLRYEVLPPDTLDGAMHDLVKVTFDEGVGESDGDWYTLYVNRDSGVVRAIRYTVTYGRGRPGPDATPRENLFYYDDLTTVDGLTVATSFRGYPYRAEGLGSLRNEAWATDISFRRPFDATKLTPPEGSRLVSPPSGG